MFEIESFDPELFWPSTVIDMIFQHLTAKEVLTATLVSPTWENLIRTSSTCMRKINLTVNGRKYFLANQNSQLKEEMNFLSVGARRYENFTFYAQRPGFLTKNVVELLASRKGKWKNVKIWSEKFNDESDAEKLFECISENVENVELRNISTVITQTSFFDKKTFEFRNLKRLCLCNVNSDESFLKMFQNCDELEFLEVENLDSDSLINFIESSPNISKLSINDAKFNDDFFRDLAKIKTLKLKEFKIKSGNSPSQQTGFNQFLESQADYIEKFVVDIKISSDAMKTVFKFPQLKNLHIITPPSYEPVELSVNESITEFHLNFKYDLQMFLSFINSMPNLVALNLSTSDEKIKTIVDRKLSKLENFVCC